MSRDWAEARAKVQSEGRCRNCGSHLNLDPAHIIPRSQASGLDSMSGDNIITLCRTCHRAYDSRQLDILHLLSPAEQTMAVKVAGGIERARDRVLPTHSPKRVGG